MRRFLPGTGYGLGLGLAIGILALGCGLQAVAQGLTMQGLTGAQIVDRLAAKNVEREAALAEWSSERVYRVEYRGMGGGSASMTVRAEFRAPGEKRLTVTGQQGSKMLCDGVLRKLLASEEEAESRSVRAQSAITNANYVARLEGEEVVDGVRAWRLALTPRVATKFSVRGRVWVSEDDFGLMRMEGEPAKEVSWWVNRATIDARYRRSGIFWLPERNESVSRVRMGGQAQLTIEYGRYTVRTVGEGGTATAKLEALR